MIKQIRLYSHHLVNPVFDKPEELVNYMGAVQAQDYTMSKWALGVRLNKPSLNSVEKALQEGKILRTHILRPTWHYVSAEDIRWMLQLTGKRIKSAVEGYGRARNLMHEDYLRANKFFEKILAGRHLTKQEIESEFIKAGYKNIEGVGCLISFAEAEGILCSGIDKNKKAAYALLEERIAPVKALHKEEALAKLAMKYFQSHSPASLNDFVWWSGLSITEARKGIEAVKSELIVDKFQAESLFIHESYKDYTATDGIVHLLPPFDEYLISYKNRADVLAPEYYPKAFTRYGIFYPVVLCNGQIVGNWKKTVKKSQIQIEISFFDPKTKIDKKLIQHAEDRYRRFFS